MQNEYYQALYAEQTPATALCLFLLLFCDAYCLAS